MINTCVNLDPDFGNYVPSVDNVFYVTVFPVDKINPPFRFVLFMPIIQLEDPEDGSDPFEEYLQLALGQLTDEGDTVKVKEFDMSKVSEINKATLCAIFNPNDVEEFVWINPPKHLRS